jgi:hypothetical protein
MSRRADEAEFLYRAVDRARLLSQIDTAVARYLSVSGMLDGNSDDDKIPVRHVSGIPAGSLKPSQTTIQVWAVVDMAVGMLMRGRVGGDLGALISSDGHILDGHHRWAATILAGGPSATVGGFVSDLPGSDLIRVLNIVTKGIYGRERGNAGTGSLSEVNPTKVRRILEVYASDGVSGEYAKSAPDIRTALSDTFGSVDAGIDQMSANAGKVSKQTPNWAPDRTDMPVIEPHEAPQAAKILSRGLVNWRYPFQREASLRARTIRLAAARPDLRTVLLALLR